MSEHHHHYGGGGISLLHIFAAYLSWITWHSLGWAIVNGMFGGFYVIYWAIRYW